MLKLLIVDDESRTRDGLKRCLSWNSLGIGEIQDADDGNTALEIAETFKPDIILTDIRMPNMEGIEFIRRLRSRNSESKVIFISGYSDKEYLKSAIQLKAVSYVEKPVNINELKAAIQDAVTMCLEDRKNYKHSKIVENSRPIIIQDLAVYLLEPGHTRNEVEKRLELSGLGLAADSYYITVLFKLFYKNSQNADLFSELKNKLANQIINSFSVNGFNNITGFKDTAHIISHINIGPSSSLYTLKKMLDGIQADFNTEFPHKTAELSIGAGITVKGMEMLYQSYETAVIAQQRSFFSRSGMPIYYEYKSEDVFSFSDSLEEKFKRYLVEEDYANTSAVIKQLTEDIRKHDNTLIHNIKSFFYRLLLILNSESDNRNIRLWPDEIKRDQLWNMLADFRSLDQVSEFLLKKVDEYFYILRDKNEKSKTVFEILKYIHANYNKSELDLNSISLLVHLTPVYICQIFKKETGKTFNTYLTEYRIEKAKELLRGSRNKLFEVTVSIGFNDTKYFIRTFKRKTGMTPTEYREKYS